MRQLIRHQPFRDLSIRRKMMLIALLTSGVASLLACAAFVTYELVMFRGAMVRDLATLADVVANNSTGSIEFDSPNDAKDVLRTLKAKPHIVAACTYTSDGKPFATYVRSGTKGRFVPPKPLGSALRWSYSDLELFRPITDGPKRDGWVYIESDLGDLYSHLIQYGEIVIVVLIACSVVAFAVSSRLQQMVSEPVLRLAEIASTVSRDRDYSVRVPEQSKDEIGVFIRAFNDMLTQIQEQDVALHRSQEGLERRVAERTQALEAEVGERRRAEAEVQKLNAELEQRVLQRTAELQAANKELEAFSYSVSHDLRAPLRGIDGFSQALLEDYGDRLDERATHYLHRVRAASQRMAQLIDDILHLSRVTRAEMRREPVDLSALGASVMAELRRNQPERRVEFIVAPGIATRGDPRLLRIVMENLLGNAWKFTSKRAAAIIEVGMEQQDGRAVYYVRDDGAGFDPAHARKLFGAFQRLHAADEFEGTGIGLATVQRIIHRHGGDVWAEGAVGRGATIYFTLSN